MHPFYARIARTGTPVVEVNIFGLTAAAWDRMRARLAGRDAVQHVSDINGLFYVRSRPLAERIKKKMEARSLRVDVAVGRIDSGTSHAFVAR